MHCTECRQIIVEVGVQSDHIGMHYRKATIAYFI